MMSWAKVFELWREITGEDPLSLTVPTTKNKPEKGGD